MKVRVASGKLEKRRKSCKHNKSRKQSQKPKNHKGKLVEKCLVENVAGMSLITTNLSQFLVKYFFYYKCFDYKMVFY